MSANPQESFSSPAPSGWHSTVLQTSDSHHRVLARESHAADDRELGVGPIQALVEVIHSQACGENNVLAFSFKSLVLRMMTLQGNLETAIGKGS